MHIKSLGLAGIASVLLAAPVFAHHSFSMFDQSKTVSVVGNVKEFEWINPHVWLHVVALADGKTWSFEAGGPGQREDRDQPGRRHEIRIIEHCRGRARRVAKLHLRDALRDVEIVP